MTLFALPHGAVMRNIELWLANNYVHADLSAYNVLYWQRQVRVIVACASCRQLSGGGAVVQMAIRMISRVGADGVQLQSASHCAVCGALIVWLARCSVA